MLTTFLEWIAWAGLVLPMSVLAWSAVQYIAVRKQEVRNNEFKRLFEVLDQMGASKTSPAAKMVAAYELRKYPEYRDVLIRFCDQI